MKSLPRFGLVLAMAVGGVACASHDACPPIDERVVARAVVDSLVGAPREDTAEELAARGAARAGGSGEVAPEEGAALPSTVAGVPVPFDELPRRGPVDARVKVLVVSDFQCPYCGQHAVRLERLQHEYPDDVALYFVNYPLPFHEHAELAAEAAIQAYEQGGDEAFYRMHDRLFAHQRELTRDELLEHARTLGLDVDAMRQALDDHRGRRFLVRDEQLVQALDVEGTPTTFVGDVGVSGAVPYATLEAAVEAALED